MIGLTPLALMLHWAISLQLPPVAHDNVPAIVSSCLMTGGRGIEVDRRMNPFYLRGDFDGDGRPDFAVLVRNDVSGKQGFTFCLSTRPKNPILVGAGTAVAMEGGRAVDHFPLIDVWGVAVLRGSRREALYLEKAEAGSGYFSWNGRGIVWTQLGI